MAKPIILPRESAARFYACQNLSLNHSSLFSREYRECSPHIFNQSGVTIPLSEKGVDIIYNRCEGLMDSDEEFVSLESEVEWWTKKLKTKGFKASALNLYNIEIIG